MAIKFIQKNCNPLSPRQRKVLDSLRIVHTASAILESWVISIRLNREWHLYHNENPGGWLIRPGKPQLPMSPDSVYLIPAGTIFGTRSNQIFTHNFIDFQLDEPPFSSVSNEIMEFPAKGFCGLLKPLADPDLENLRAHALIFEALLMIPAERYLPAGKLPLDDRIQRILNYFEWDCHENTDVGTLSKWVNMSVSNFHRLFKRQVGLSPRQYFMNIRLERGRRMLLEGSASIDEIAARTFFANRNHFTLAFTRIYGMPPAAFRKANAGKRHRDLPRVASERSRQQPDVEDMP